MMLPRPQSCLSLLEREISVRSQKGRGSERGGGWRASTPLRPAAPFLQVAAPPDESQNKEGGVCVFASYRAGVKAALKRICFEKKNGEKKVWI